MSRATPLEVFSNPVKRRSLSLSDCDRATNPFVNPEALSETYLFGLLHDQVQSRLAMLLGIWTSLSPPAVGNVGLLLFSGVSEFGWKAVEWDIPPDPHWWIILEYTKMSLSETPRVEVMSQEGWVPRFEHNPNPTRYKFMLDPHGEAIVSFKSVTYLIGTQPVMEDDLRAEFTADTDWHAACEWPA
jgi:hypothetical protein